MPKTRPLRTTYSKGELSPLLEGQTSLVAYFEGGSTVENFLIMRQGGLRRWPGTRFIEPVKDSSKDTILWPFQFSVDDAYILEVGDQYIRFYKNKAQILSGGVPYELATPFAVADIRAIHFTQSADVLFTFHTGYQQRKLNRIADTNWVLTSQSPVPPPSFEDDTDLAATLGVAANTGSSIKMRAGSAVFLAGDVGRQIISGAGRAVITAVDDTSQVTVDMLDAFAATITAGPDTATTVGIVFTSVGHGLSAGDFISITSGTQSGQVRRVVTVTDPDNVDMDAAMPADIAVAATWNKVVAIASGAWLLRLSPQVTLDPTIKGPIGAQVTLVAGAACFRAADVGKFIHIYGGVVKITNFDSTIQVRGEIMSEMGDTTDVNPAAAPAGAWTLEVASWSSTNGFPRTGEFFQGRLAQAATLAQPTTWWASRSDDYDNYAVGVTAEDAIEYTIASRQVNRIEWLTENSKALFLGTSGSEHVASGSGNDNALISGDNVPLLDRMATNGCMGVQPVVSRKSIIYIDRSREKVMSMAFDVYSDSDVDKELSIGAEHITESGVRLGPLAFQSRKDPRIYFVREDGTLVGMTYYPDQKITAFSRRVTEGTFESVAVIPSAGGGNDQVWVIAKRTINGQTKRYVEMFEENHEDLASREWTSLQTDAGIVYNGAPADIITGLDHLEGKTVDVVADSGYIGQKTVTAGQITLDEEASIVEIGLHYESTYVSMRPAIEGQVIEGIPRSWDKLWARVFKTIGGKGNGAAFVYPPSPLNENIPYTGDIAVSAQGWDTDGRFTIMQHQPYPMTLLSCFGTLSIGDSD